MPSQEQLVSIAEDLLSHRFGGSQRLEDVEVLAGSGESTVLRARVASQPFLQYRTVVLKFVPMIGEVLYDAALMREVVAYQFTTALPENVRPGPMLLAHDIDQRLVVMTDSGDGDTFDDLLETAKHETRGHILRNLGSSLGRMHAGTAEREKEFDILMARMLKQHPQFGENQEVRDDALQQSILLGEQILEQSGFSVPQAFHDAAQVARKRVVGGSARAFTPFDLSPDNIIVAEKTHFLDYEWAGFRDVSFDIACVVAGFPQFVFTHPITDEEADTFISAWKREIKEVFPNLVEPHNLHARVLAALVGWGLSTLATMSAGNLSGVVGMVQKGEDISTDLDQAAALLRTGSADSFSDDELLARRDIYETFEAMSRFGDNGTEDTSAEIAEFARSIAQRVEKPGWK
ncbi:phosphotransferase [Corynebacterium propinquum]|uniref:Phosphotransferase n=1 Tax=Corynebacterium propinquum TaxID=43769 RepID=A0AAP4F6D4_9CORY|nr:phosphotransferase [Corynebacterium propinquum]MCT1817823.1 phosphotransferase [Corynebacterium propinquum]MDK4234076.1 phosphotransferase [Corynebacterium propinquum]MDK4256869.1 phosphotransferase [Corynebacterium propinquum]MDK4281103.1 phosphotransferase [Corynebacterium propinquum]MDK4291318.1 phosphotransferase [Corynebacterium propinquum]